MFLEQIDNFGTQRAVSLISQFLSKLAQNEGFHAGLSNAITQSMELWGDKSMRSLLAESGMGEQWVTQTQPMIVQLAHDLVKQEPFQQWLRELVQSKNP